MKGQVTAANVYSSCQGRWNEESGKERVALPSTKL